MSGYLHRLHGLSSFASSRDRAVDLAVAGVATLFNIAGAVSRDSGIAYDLSVGHPVLVAASAAAGTTLLVRRRHPLAVFVLVTFVVTVVHLSHWQNGFLPFTLLLAAYALGAFGTARAAVAGAATFAGSVGVLFAAAAPYFDSPIGLQALAQVGAAGLLGAAVARRHSEAESAAARAARLARESVRDAERVVLAERLRVARELNAAVSDAMSAITLQAAVARRHFEADDGVLATIERSGRNATEDLRRLLRTLRRVDSASADPATRAVAGPTGRRPWGVNSVDVALGTCVVLFNVLGSALPDPSTPTRYGAPVPLTLIPLVALPGLSLIVRRQCPVAALVAALATLGLVGGFGWQTGSLPGSVLIATFALGSWAPVSRGLFALAGMWLTMIAIEATDQMPPEFRDDGSLTGALVIFTLPWVVGVGMRRQRVADQERVASALVAEREHAAAIERALTDERLAVARDLHDLVSHSLAAITVQAAAARRRDEPGGETLEVIERTGRAALADLRQMLRALRQPGRAISPPPPGLPEIEELVARHCADHGPVHLVIDPALELQPASLRTTAFRVVQESLTNVARHAPGAAAVVTLAASNGGFSVDVTNLPMLSSSTNPGTGWGLTGMRERVDLVGGTLTAAEDADGGFAVHAQLGGRVTP